MAEIPLDVSATLTSGGRGVGGVRIGSDGIMSGGTPVDAAGAVTDADGVAHYSCPADADLAIALTPITAVRTIGYAARTMLPGGNLSGKVCNLLTTRSPRVDLHYQP